MSEARSVLVGERSVIVLNMCDVNICCNHDRDFSFVQGHTNPGSVPPSSPWIGLKNITMLVKFCLGGIFQLVLGAMGGPVM